MKTPWDGHGDPSGSAIEQRLAAEGLSPSAWGNASADPYGWHSHEYHKGLYCVSGSIVFHVPGGDVELRPGDRLDLEPGTEHAATVGPEGVRCLEASR